MQPNALAVVVELLPLPELSELSVAWRALEARSDSGFFLSWPWIGTWLSRLPPKVKPQLLRVRREGQVVGLAILCKRVAIRRFVASRVLYLNCTGEASLDEITIEYNGFLAERGLEADVASAAFAFLARKRGWDEIGLKGCHGDDPTGSIEPPGLRRVEAKHRSAWYVDLEAVRASGGDYEAGLGRNVRQKVQRSRREAERFGPLVAEVAGTLDEALAIYADLKRLHGLAWEARGEEGAFANAFLDSFHDALIRSHFAEGAIQMIRVRAGERVIGCLYNFVQRDVVYQYQSGFNFGMSEGNAWRPGLVSHVLAIDLNLRAGRTRYDFLAGDHRYKKDLGNASGTMHWISLQRPRLQFAVERGARKALGRLRGKVAGPPPASAPGAGDS